MTTKAVIPRLSATLYHSPPLVALLTVTVSLLPIKRLNSPLVVNLEVRSNARTMNGVHMLLLKAA